MKTMTTPTDRADTEGNRRMRTRDHKELAKHLQAIQRIQPLCHSELMPPIDHIGTMRYRLTWTGKTIHAALVCGELVNGEPCTTQVGMLCIDHALQERPGSGPVVFFEFRNIATGNLVRLRHRLKAGLTRMTTPDHEGGLLVIMAKNPTMYDKLGALIAPPWNPMLDAWRPAP